MTTLSWNRRGLAAAPTISELKELCREYKLAIVFLMETRARKEQIERMKRRLQFKFCFCVEPRGLAGGLAIFWSSGIQLQVIKSSHNFIHTAIFCVEDRLDFDATFVYGNPIFQQRRHLWERLQALQMDKRRQWICIGDFNDMLAQHEKDGLRLQPQNRIDLFRNFLSGCELMDFDLKGCKFTWMSNPRDGFVTREKLDRVLGNWSWRSDHPHAVAIALPIISSDHSPLILIPSPEGRSGRQFKYEAFWEEHADCSHTVQEGWNLGSSVESGWHNVLVKTKLCKERLKKWHHHTFKRADKGNMGLKRQLNDMLNQESSRVNWSEVGDIKKQIKELWKQEEIFWGQRSRLKWLNWGDKNSKFFHASTIQRRDRNRLQRIKNDQGSWIEGQNNISQAILEHYSEVYKTEGTGDMHGCLQAVPRLVTNELNEALMTPVKEEIKRTVFCMGALKAPGPDGLNGLFFQKNWDTIKNDVIQAVQEFFVTGVIPLEVNETVVTLTPKIPLPDCINHLRPISCCNFLYKILSKIMVMRLKGFMEELISQNQSAFEGGRLIQDNLSIAHEIFHALKRKNRRGRDSVALKVDMSKAYDRVEWEFLKNTLLVYGFDASWVKLIMGLVTSVSYRYKINGHLSEKLVPQRGLRQGDPLSPYLFILMADVLSHLLLRAQEAGNFKGICLAADAPFLTHLFFADDALFFMQATPEEMFQLVQILNLYCQASGQKINLMKSGLICGCAVPVASRHRLEGILHIQEWNNPGKYLGVPADWGRSRSSALGWIKDKILTKVDGWKEKLLNQAGKEVLIKAVIQAIPSYAMSLIRFPKNFCKQMYSIIAQFWWSSYGKNRGIHWKNWEYLTGNKSEGGMGFKDFDFMNSAMLAKQAWRILQNPNSLWAQVLKSIYFPNGELLRAKRGRNDSLEFESVEHALLLCDWTRTLWFGSQFQQVPERNATTNFCNWLNLRVAALQSMPEVREFALVSIVCTLWMIWKGRNQFVFEGIVPNPAALLHQIQAMQAEFAEQLGVTPVSFRPVRSQQGQLREVWQPPLNEMVKVNSDASFLKDKGHGCTGVIIRNNKGEVLSGLTRCFHSSSSLQAEAVALRDAVNLAHNLDLGKVIFECDNLELVKNCRGEIFSGEIQHIVQDILWYKDKFRHFGLTYLGAQER